MKNRRRFLQAVSSGVFLSALASLPKLSFSEVTNGPGIVLLPNDGETYIVRENTPITIKLSKKTHQIDSISICTEEIPPGNGIAVHKHLNEDEFFFFQKGGGTLLIEEEEIIVSEGYTALVPKGTWHGLKNTGKETIVFTFGYTPAGFEDFFRQIGTPKGNPFKAKTADEFKAIANKYGILYKN